MKQVILLYSPWSLWWKASTFVLKKEVGVWVCS